METRDDADSRLRYTCTAPVHHVSRPDNRAKCVRLSCLFHHSHRPRGAAVLRGLRAGEWPSHPGPHCVPAWTVWVQTEQPEYQQVVLPCHRYRNASLMFVQSVGSGLEVSHLHPSESRLSPVIGFADHRKWSRWSKSNERIRISATMVHLSMRPSIPMTLWPRMFENSCSSRRSTKVC